MNITPLEITGTTDVGATRDHNEDCIAWRGDLGLVVLADGMGGHNAGEVASDIAVKAIIADFEQNLSQRAQGSEQAVTASLNAINRANQAIFSAAQQDSTYSGMGTTIVTAVFQDGLVTISHVGDSRMYRFRDNALQQQTVDHSLVQEMVQSGYLTAEEASLSANKNMITRALGIDRDVEIDVQQHHTKVGDIYLVCSDGLSDLVSQAELLSLLSHGQGDLSLAGRELIAAANRNGGLDNISVVLVRVTS